MKEINLEQLKQMLFFSYIKIEENKERINKINVFPVPDQDTGGNLAKTLEGIKRAIEQKKEIRDIKELTEIALDGALESAQGNAGVIYAGFLSGFLPVLKEKNPINIQTLSLAFEKGVRCARDSIQHPKEGTILDVIEASTKALSEEAKKDSDIISVFKKVIAKANDALLATKEKMEILKKANVVDAGGLGFLIILESYLEALQGEKLEESKKEIGKMRSFIQTISSRYEVVFLIEEPKIKKEELAKKLSLFGNSIEVLSIKNKIKVHIHTDEPDEIKKIARQAGKVKSLRIEDMAKEIVGEDSVKESSIGLVVDETCDILDKIIEKYKIGFVRHKIEWPAGEKLKGDNIYQKMREAENKKIKELPKTAQASPKNFLDIYKKTFENLSKNGKIISIVLSSKLSGAFNSAKQAEKLFGDNKVKVIDSLNVSAGLALLILKAIELVQEQRDFEEIIEELEKIIENQEIKLYGALDDPRWLEAGGRMSSNQAKWVRRMQKIGIRPLITVKEGKIEKGGIVFGAEDLATALFKKFNKLTKKIIKNKKKIRAIINHCDNEPEARKLKEMLKEIGVEVQYVNLVSPIIGSHVGPGTLILGWMEV